MNQATQPLIAEEKQPEILSNVERKKQLQKIKILKHLYIKGAESNADICERFNISSPTSMNLLNQLIRQGLVVKQGRGKSIGGRKPDLFGLRDHSLFVLAIHIENFRIRLAIFDNNNNSITGIETIPFQIAKDLSIVNKLYEHAQKLIDRSGIEHHKFLGIGICLPGLVSSKEGKSYTYFLGEHEGESFQQLLEKRFKKPVLLLNDVKSACLAEFRFGLAKNRKNTLVLSMDWGIGLGIIMDGKMHNGASGFAGEFGHIPLVEDGLLCHCGKRGCLETVASGTALVRMAREGVRSGQSSLLNELSDQEIDQIEPQTIIEAANNGDQFAINILSQIGVNLGKGIAILIQLFNPELIILEGKIADAKQFITTPIQQSINTYCMAQLRERTQIALSDLGPDASLLGSVAAVMENIFADRIALAKSQIK